MVLGVDALAVADRFYSFGALGPARQLYEEILQEHPDNTEVWCRFGQVHRSLGRHADAVACYRRALALRPDNSTQHNNLGAVLLAQGQAAEAVACFREALRLQPDHAEAHNNLGAALLSQSRPDEATACFREALRLRPDYAAAHSNLGHGLAAQGRLEEAVDSYRKSVQLQPDFARAWCRLGSTLRDLGRQEEAGASFERVLQLQPAEPAALNELAALRLAQGRAAEAVAYYERLLRLRPDATAACNNLGLALLDQGRPEEAALSFRQSLYLQPELAEAHNNLGLALMNHGRREEALASFRQALDLAPDLADAHNNLGLALAAEGRPDEALACYEQAVLAKPNHDGALTNLGNAFKDQGRLAEAIACYRSVLAIRPDHARGQVRSNLLLALHYQPGVDPQEILCEARRFAQQHAAPLGDAIQPFVVRPLSGRRLRIGYVSADFRDHPVAYFLEPILAAHDRRSFEIVCYANSPTVDAVTQRMQTYAEHWRSLVGMSDDHAAEAIRRDGIEILVDLAGHTGGNRLLVFARKPAPVQASYLGYLGTTGLPTIDYYITDAHTDPPGLTETHFQEQLIRLPECAFCYQPGPAPEVNPELPARQSGCVTFGCLNIPAKLTEEVLALWSRVLESVPGSRIMLRAGEGRRAEERVRNLFARNGISSERVVLAGWTATRFDYLRLFHELDLCLDPFPYNGITTTCDALWMGVPVISLTGLTSVSRHGVRYLSNVGLEELLAESADGYARIATELARDLPRLAALRRGLRERMRVSPLMDAARLTRHLEAAYRGMWDRCLTASP
jgi:protein O-GlcNAc transferase